VKRVACFARVKIIGMEISHTKGSTIALMRLINQNLKTDPDPIIPHAARRQQHKVGLFE
jgi:hypothetical protein